MINRLIPLLVLALFGPFALAQTLEPGPLTAKELAQGYRDGYVMAKPKPRSMATVAAAEKGEGLRMRKKFDRFGGLRVLKLSPGETVKAAVARLQATGRYEFVEPDYTRTAYTIPNDAWFLPDPTRSMSQWGLNNDGAEFPGNGVVGADIHAEAAWDVIHDAPGVIVAVLDTGVNLSHPDLSGNIWSNPAQLSDGYPVGIHGLNMSENAASVTDPSDDNGHGTHVSGILGAVGNNGIYFAGVAWKVQIMGLKFLDSSGGSNSISDEVACIDFAILHGASIINASFGSPKYSASEFTAIQAAGAAGIIFVAAAGNRSDDNDLSPDYPASHLLDNIVAVAASDNRDDSVFFTSYGCGLVDLSAPGEYIYSLWTSPTNYLYASGTSMSAPFVTGSLALLKAKFPADTYRQLINRLLNSVDRNVNFLGRNQTNGRLNLAAAVTSTSNRPFNDVFANRARISGPSVTVRSNNAGASRETVAGEPVIGGDAGGASLWWEWTAPTSGSVNVTTAGSAYSTLLGVYTGSSVGSLTAVATNAASGTGASAVTFTAQAGLTYEISADGQGGATGLTVLNFSYGNDAFASPVVLTGASAGVMASNANATAESGELPILGHAANHSVWYAWTAPKSGAIQVSALSFDFDPLLAVYTGTSVTSLTIVLSSAGGAIDPGTVYTASIPASFCTCSFAAVGGTTYYLSVDGFIDVGGGGTQLDSGQFTLALSDADWAIIPAAPANPGPVDDSITCSPSVGSDGSIYVGSKNGYFYAYRPDGSIKWRVNTSLPLDSTSAAISSDGTAVYVGGNSYIYAFSTVDGSTLWQYSPGRPAVTSTAVGADGTVYVKTSAGILYALSPGVSNSGRVKWMSTIPGSSTAAPTVAANGVIYLGASDSNFYAINPGTGSLRPFAADGAIYGAAAIDSAGNVYFGTLAGTLYAVSPTGAKLWSYKSGGSIDSAPVIGADGAIYFGSHDRNLYALNYADGSLRWACPLGDEVRGSSPAIDSNGLIYVGCYDNNLYAVNPGGTVNRTFATNFWVQSSPVIANGKLYFGSSDHKLYAYSIGANAAVSPWPMYQYNASRTGLIPAVVTTQPQSQTLSAGAPLSLTVAAMGSSAVSYQWNLNGVAIAGATGSTYSVASFGPANVGLYAAVITTAQGSITSNPATIASTAQPPVFTVNPVAVNIAAGRSAAFSVAATGTPAPTYQWNLNGTPIPGATDPILQVRNAASANAGSYTCTATNSVSSVTSSAAALTVTATNFPGYLINISARASVGTGSNILFGGFGVYGTGTKQLLIRGAGPSLALAPFNISAAMATPQLTLFDNNGAIIASNLAWGVAPTAGPSAGSSPPTIASTTVMNSVGAFNFPAGSNDTSMIVTAPSGNNTMQVSGVGGTTGVGLVEIYDADSTYPPVSALINISARAFVGTSTNILIGGFAIYGTTSETILVRADGPTLGDAPFGISGVLAQPVLTIFNNQGVAIYSNTGWGGDATLAAVFPTVGAFTLNSSHNDSALLVSLPPGNYTAQVSGLNGTTGVSLVEIYDVP